MANNAVAIKLPTFWTEQPDIWFTQAEAQFQIRNISADETKYYHVVAALDQTAAKRVITVLSNPPEDNKYRTLKDILINTYGLCEAERASQLLHLSGLGDAKPSEYMDNMLALLGNQTPCFLFRQLFIEQMPANMRPHLARINDDNYRTLAQEADKLWHSNPSPSCDAIANHNQSMSRQATKHRRLPPPSSDNIPSTTSGECYYHRRFGTQARQCRPPCTFQGNDQTGRW